METLIHNSNEMDAYAAHELAALPDAQERGVHPAATLLGLSGGLGAGKTSFVQSLARALLLTESVTSPTFVIARFYPLAHHSVFTRLIHVDAYRIEDTRELGPIGWDEILRDPKALVVVEWPEMLKEYFPKDARTLRFEVVDETTRKICAA